MSDEKQEDWLGFPSLRQGVIPLLITPSPDDLEQLKKEAEQLEIEMRDANYAAFGGPRWNPYKAYDSDDDDKAYDSDDD